ncbi:MAG: LuxR C-terminal-related transcriptional regulator [Solirubrobacteraceae bacterium]
MSNLHSDPGYPTWSQATVANRCPNDPASTSDATGSLDHAGERKRAAGFANANLALTAKTASAHVSHILMKLGVANRAEAAAAAHRIGLTGLSS